jgi:integrase
VEGDIYLGLDGQVAGERHLAMPAGQGHHRVEDQPAHQAGVAIVAVVHGLLPELLTTIRVATRRQQGRKLLREDGIYLDKERLTITQLLPIQLEPEFLLAAKQWEDQGLVEIHLHPMLRTMLKGLLNHYPLPKNGERWIPSNSPATRVLPRGMTALKLCRCFESYYCQRHGLEPELASMVAGRPVLGRNSSIHYFRSTSEHLHREHWQAFERFHHEIISVCGDPDLPSRLPQPATTPEPSSRPVGSLFYPSKSELTAYLAALRDRLDHLRRVREYRAWREVLCLYVYECLRLVTGMRVIDKPMFNAFALMGEGRWLRLQEKGPNPRVVPVHPVVADLVRKLANENAWLQGRLWSHGPRYNRPLFFIERGRKTELLSNLVIGDVCQRHGIARPEIRPNAHRHLMRSQIHDCGLSHQIADFVLGHTHYGPHVQDQLSLVPMEQLRRHFMPVADSLVSELGIQTVRAWS